MTRVLITRPAAQVESLLQLLAAPGLEVVSVPLVAIAAIDDAHRQQQIRDQVLGLDDYQRVIAISTNAAQAFVHWADQFWPQWPVGIQWWGIGEKTTRVWRDQGLDAHSPAVMNSEGLLAEESFQAAAVAGQKILLCCGEGGRQTLQEVLTSRGAVVSRCELYRRVLPAGARQQLESLAQSPADILTVSSGEGLGHLTRLLESLHLLKNSQARSLVVPSPRVAAQARELGWRNITVADNATDEAMAGAIGSLVNPH